MHAAKRLIGSTGVVCLLTFAVGCATTKSHTEATTTSPAPGTTQPVSWDGHLLTVSDLGADWKVSNPLNEQDLVAVAQSPCGTQTVDPAVAARLKATTGIQFEPTSKASRHLIEFALSGDPVQLAADIDSFTKSVLACGTEPTTSSGNFVLVSTLAMPKLGDQRVGFVFDGKESADATATWHVRNAIVRVGNRAISVSLTEILEPGQSVDVSDNAFLDIVTKAVAHLG